MLRLFSFVAILLGPIMGNAAMQKPAQMELSSSAKSEAYWEVVLDATEEAGTDHVFMGLPSSDAIVCAGAGELKKLYLALRCIEDTTIAYLTSRCSLLSGQNGTNLTYIIDETAPSKAYFELSDDETAIGLWKESVAISFIKQLLDSKTLLVRFTPYGDSPVSARFNTTGLREAIKPLREACNW